MTSVTAAFGISDWPVLAVKDYLGHTIAPASGDQLSVALGAFQYGVLPDIRTIDAIELPQGNPYRDMVE